VAVAVRRGCRCGCIVCWSVNVCSHGLLNFKRMEFIDFKSCKHVLAAWIASIGACLETWFWVHVCF